MFEKYYSSLYQKINPREQLIEETREKMYAKLAHRNTWKPSVLKICVSICLLLLFSGSITAFAYHLSGGDFFRQFFTDRMEHASETEYSSVDLSQLNDMASDTIGIVVDTDEITIDVMGAIVCKNTASILLRVTANQLDSVLIEGDHGPVRNYRFLDNTYGNLFKDCRVVSYRYYYSDEKKDLGKNQLEILYTVIKKEDMQGKQYEMGLEDFGSNRNKTNNRIAGFNILYQDNWKFTIDFPAESSNAKTLDINKQVPDHDIIVNNINITPLAMTVDFTGIASDEEAFHQEFDYLNEKVDLKLHFRNGNIMTEEDCRYSTGAGDGKYNIIAMFNAPVNMEEIVAVTLFDKSYSLQ
jgi:hypothetical protein